MIPFGTFLAIFLLGIYYFFASPTLAAPYLSIIFFIVSFVVLTIQIATSLFAWGPLTRLEVSVLPRTIETFRKDFVFLCINLILLGYLLLSVFFFVNLNYFPMISTSMTLSFWIVATGAAFDLVHFHFRRMLQFIDPYWLLSHFKNVALSEITSTHEKGADKWFNTYSEIASRAILSNTPSIAIEAFDQIRHLVEEYLALAKSVMYHEEDQIPLPEHVSYTLFRLSEQIERLFLQAKESKNFILCEEILTLLGKLIFFSTRFDFTLSAIPIKKLGTLSIGSERFAHHAICTYVRVSQIIVKEVSLEYMDLHMTFIPIINQMTKLTEWKFKQNKEQKISALKQPFLQLKETFLSDELKTHQDLPTLLTHIEKALAKFQALEDIMQTIPPKT